MIKGLMILPIFSLILIVLTIGDVRGHHQNVPPFRLSRIYCLSQGVHHQPDFFEFSVIRMAFRSGGLLK